MPSWSIEASTSNGGEDGTWGFEAESVETVPFSAFRLSFSYSVLMFSLIHQGARKAYDQQF